MRNLQHPDHRLHDLLTRVRCVLDNRTVSHPVEVLA